MTHADNRLAVFATVLDLAVSRYFAAPVDLVPALTADPQGTLFALSSAPSSFGPILADLSPDARKTALIHLLTAAKAFVVAARQSATDVSTQLSLNLTDSE